MFLQTSPQLPETRQQYTAWYMHLKRISPVIVYSNLQFQQ
jgi:hypothetical protein